MLDIVRSVIQCEMEMRRMGRVESGEERLEGEDGEVQLSEV